MPSDPTDGWCQISYIASSQPVIYEKKGGKLGHLADRGWVLQERILSRRIIHFAQEEVYWECNDRQVSEAWPDSIGASALPPRPSIGLIHGMGFWVNHLLWIQVIVDYSARRLTYERDKLPALSGLAREREGLRKGPHGAYLAGLWRWTVLIDLCWSTSDDATSIPGEYLAPSWSWASLHGRVTYKFPSSNPTFKRITVFKDARLKLTTADPYGALDDGWLHLFGHLSRVMLVRQKKTAAEGIQDPGYWRQTVGDYNLRSANGDGLVFIEFSDISLDIESVTMGERRSVSMFCLPLLDVGRVADNGQDYRRLFCCLLLVPYGFSTHTRPRETLQSPRTQNADEYQRVGLARIMVNKLAEFKAWLKENPRRDVVIR